MLKYIISVLFIYCGISVNAQQPRLKKLKLPMQQTAVYNCTGYENYWVNQGTDSVPATDQVITHMHTQIAVEVLGKQKNKLQIDFNQSDFGRTDSILMPLSAPDVSKKTLPLLNKLILYFDRQGNYLAPSVSLNNPEYGQRDFRFFYNSAKQLIYSLTDSSRHADTWQTQHVDTVLTTAFELVHTHTRTWHFAGMVDTMGYSCVRLNYTSPAQSYYAVNGIMKALGLQMVHSGQATINGTLLLDKKTGRLISLQENGMFTGFMDMKTPSEQHHWPSQYSYTKSYTLQQTIQNGRKKILGIF